MAKASLERTAAGAVRADVRPAYEERVGSQGEDVVDARGGVFRELEQGADTLQQRFGSVHGPQPDGPVVHVLDGRRPRRSAAIEAIEVPRSHQR